MSIEIKFRAWHKEDQKMFVVVGVSFGINLESDNTEILSVSCAEVAKGRWKFAGDHDADEVILMQSTGLKDKNGVDVYEGDIVASYYGAPIRTVIAPVVFEESCFLVKTPSHNPKKCVLAEFIGAMHETEVIGNIHENPELLECKQ